MKRRVAGLTPVSVEVFTQKVLERQAETAIMASPKGSMCEACGHVCYTSFFAFLTDRLTERHIPLRTPTDPT